MRNEFYYIIWVWNGCSYECAIWFYLLAGTSKRGIFYGTFHTKLWQQSRFWIGILRQTSQIKPDDRVGFGIDEGIMVSKSWCEHDFSRDKRRGENTKQSLQTWWPTWCTTWWLKPHEAIERKLSNFLVGDRKTVCNLIALW